MFIQNGFAQILYPYKTEKNNKTICLLPGLHMPTFLDLSYLSPAI
jgi:hypothetical protein